MLKSTGMTDRLLAGLARVGQDSRSHTQKWQATKVKSLFRPVFPGTMVPKAAAGLFILSLSVHEPPGNEGRSFRGILACSGRRRAPGYHSRTF